MSSTTDFAGLPLYDPNGADSAVNGLDYFNALTNASGSAMTIIDEHLEGLTNDKQDVIQCSTLPQVTAADNGKIVQYVGAGNASATPSLITGHWYQVVSGAWQEIVYGDPNSVSYSTQTGRSDADKEQARNNIEAQQETSALIEENALDDSDYIPVYDTSSSKNRKTLWSNIKSKLKSYFDGLYVPDTRTINEKLLDANIVLDAEDVGAATDTHTHGNITNNGSIGTESNLPVFTGADGVLQAVDPVVARHYLGAQSNLLDNWYFSNPINQREATEAINTFGIDRWSGVYKLVADGITDRQAGQASSLTQYVPSSQISIDNILTFSILFSNGEMAQHVFPILLQKIDTGSSFQISQTIAVSEGKQFWFGSKYEPSKDAFRFSVTFANFGLVISAIKIEQGTRQTLARYENGAWVLNDQPPDYWQELAKCQRYYRPIPHYTIAVSVKPDKILFSIPLVPPMRGVPSVGTTSAQNFITQIDVKNYSTNAISDAPSDSAQKAFYVAPPNGMSYDVSNITACHYAIGNKYGYLIAEL